MKISMDIELEDIPGQLVHALEPVSDFGGNIVSVLHQRDKKTPSGRVPVQLVVEIEEKRLDKLVDGLKGKGMNVVRIGKERLKESMVVLLIGHIVHSDMRETIDSIDSTGFAEVVKLSLSMPGVDKKSSASVTLSAIGEDELNEALAILEEATNKKGIMVISSI
ncbi:amino acid-binding protein [ANME-1 cluster archaeon AG-394-G21]|nr:amino acid-binding protein [ANME-1 cluster archaeon AG-394-G21]NAT10766.1 amino acid-binding protein [ANME-1 cluster archaeon AG-394-G06]